MSIAIIRKPREDEQQNQTSTTKTNIKYFQIFMSIIIKTNKKVKIVS